MEQPSQTQKMVHVHAQVRRAGEGERRLASRPSLLQVDALLKDCRSGGQLLCLVRANCLPAVLSVSLQVTSNWPALSSCPRPPSPALQGLWEAIFCPDMLMCAVPELWTTMCIPVCRRHDHSALLYANNLPSTEC